jgi:hypothetical protein
MIEKPQKEIEMIKDLCRAQTNAMPPGRASQVTGSTQRRKEQFAGCRS